MLHSRSSALQSRVISYLQNKELMVKIVLNSETENVKLSNGFPAIVSMVVLIGRVK